MQARALAVAIVALSFAALWLPLVKIGFYGFPSVLVFGAISDIEDVAKSGGFAVGVAATAALETLVFIAALVGLKWRTSLLVSGSLALISLITMAMAFLKLPHELGEGWEQLAAVLVGPGESLPLEALVAALSFYAYLGGDGCGA